MKVAFVLMTSFRIQHCQNLIDSDQAWFLVQCYQVVFEALIRV